MTQLYWFALAGMYYDVYKGFSLVVNGEEVIGTYAVQLRVVFSEMPYWSCTH